MYMFESYEVLGAPNPLCFGYLVYPCMGYAWVIPVPLVERTLCLVQTWFSNPQKPVFGQIQPVFQPGALFRSDGSVMSCSLSGPTYPFTRSTHPHRSCQTQVFHSVARVNSSLAVLRLCFWFSSECFPNSSRHVKPIQDKRFSQFS